MRLGQSLLWISSHMGTRLQQVDRRQGYEVHEMVPGQTWSLGVKLVEIGLEHWSTKNHTWAQESDSRREDRYWTTECSPRIPHCRFQRHKARHIHPRNFAVELRWAKSFVKTSRRNDISIKYIPKTPEERMHHCLCCLQMLKEVWWDLPFLRRGARATKHRR